MAQAYIDRDSDGNSVGVPFKELVKEMMSQDANVKSLKCKGLYPVELAICLRDLELVKLLDPGSYYIVKGQLTAMAQKEWHEVVRVRQTIISTARSSYREQLLDWLPWSQIRSFAGESAWDRAQRDILHYIQSREGN